MLILSLRNGTPDVARHRQSFPAAAHHRAAPSLAVAPSPDRAAALGRGPPAGVLTAA